MESILTTVKKLLGIHEDYTQFDADIIVCINTALSTLYHIGYKEESFEIEGKDETWSDLFGEDKNVQLIKSYISLKVRLLFDPPTNGSVKEALEKNLSEIEWRINVETN